MEKEAKEEKVAKPSVERTRSTHNQNLLEQDYR
jgi:hypothetical protein